MNTRSLIWFCGIALALSPVLVEVEAQVKLEPEKKVTLRVSGYDLSETTVQVSGTAFSRFSFDTQAGFLPEKQSGNRIDPPVAVKYVYLALPPESKVTVTARSIVSETKSGKLLSPFVDSDSAETVYEKRYANNAFYQAVTPYPVELAEVVRYYYIGTQYVAQIRVAPVQVIAARQEMTWHRQIELSVRLNSVGAVLQKTLSETQSFKAPNAAEERFLRRHIWNYAQSKAWRRPPSDMPMQPVTRKNIAGTASRGVGDWYVPGQPYLKLATHKDGVHRFTGADIAAAGVSLLGINPNTLRLIFKGNDVPLYLSGASDGNIDGTDTLEFLGSVNRGSPQPVINDITGQQIGTVTDYTDLYTDTTAYWLTWGGASGRRFGTQSAAPANTTPYSSFTYTLHVETDTLYYVGNGETGDGYLLTEQMPGEGWLWRQLQSNSSQVADSISVNFFLDGVTPSGAAQLSIRLVGISRADHLLDFTLNGIAIGSRSFSGRTQPVITLSIDNSLLRSGANTLRLTLRTGSTSSVPSVVGLDWIEPTYTRDFSYPTVTDTQLRFTTGNAVQDVALTGAANVVAYNLTDTTRLSSLTGGRFQGQANAAYQVAATALKPQITLYRGSNLRSTSNGADYLIITPPEFESEATRLATFRASAQGGGYRTKVVITDAVYTEFNNGIVSPHAIKQFLKFAFDSWQPPKLRYVTLLGGGTWDSKYRIKTAVRKLPIIPVYGNPVSDLWLVSFDNAPAAPFIHLPKLALGRIPAQTLPEAKAYIDKVIAQESVAQAEAWNKKFLFITGGFGIGEQQDFINKSTALMNSYVLPNPVSGTADSVHRDDASPYVSSQNAERMRTSIEGGTVSINYIGHAGSQTWDNTLNDPATLTNAGKYPLVSSWTCHTGRFAEPYSRSFGETFVLTPNAGAIGFLGTSGWGFVYQDGILNQAVYESMRDSVRAIGDILLDAHQALLNQTPVWLLYNMACLDQYNIEGDAAARLALPVKPDLSLKAEDVYFFNAAPVAQEPQRIAVVARNYGLAAADSVRLRIYDRWAQEQTQTLLVDTVLAPMRLRDSLVTTLSVGNKPGNHDITVRLNEDNRLAELSAANNAVTLRATFLSNEVSQVKPFNFAVVHPSQKTLRVIQQSQVPNPSRFYEFELDTVSTFESPQQVSGSVPEGALETAWTPIFTPKHQLPYFWRVRVVLQGQPSPWKIFSLRFDSTVAVAAPQVWLQRSEKQLRFNALTGLKAESGALTNGEQRLPILLRSGGFRHKAPARVYHEITVNGDVQYGDNVTNQTTGIYTRGLNIAILDTATGLVPTRIQTFDLYKAVVPENGFRDTLAVPRLIALIDSLKPHQILLLALQDAVPDDEAVEMQPLKSKFAELGSVHFNSIRFGESWVFAGSKNKQLRFEQWGEQCLPESETGCDVLDKPTRIDTAITVLNPVGTATTEYIGPASKWTSLSWTQELPAPDAQIKMTVYGVRPSGAVDSLLTVASPLTSADLSMIDAKRYPSIFLKATLRRDLARNASPRLTGVGVSYIGAGDAATAYTSLAANGIAPEQGDTLQMALLVSNIGYSRLDSVKANLYIRSGASGAKQLLKTETIDSLAAGQQKSVSFNVLTRSYLGAQTLTAELDVDNKLVELSKLNNLASLSVAVQGDTVKPHVEIAFDGKRIRSGDYVLPTPKITIGIDDASPLPLDSSAVRIFIDGNAQPEPYSAKLRFVPPATVIYEPSFSDGEHQLFALVRDASGNAVDSALTNVSFKVNSVFEVSSFYNYPNPFSDKTQFAFLMTGASTEMPVEFKVKIYTVSGRMIKEIDAMPFIRGVGYTMVPWDGRDTDGDLVGNGVYIYRLVVRSPKQTITKTEKLAIVR